MTGWRANVTLNKSIALQLAQGYISFYFRRHCSTTWYMPTREWTQMRYSCSMVGPGWNGRLSREFGEITMIVVWFEKCIRELFSISWTVPACFPSACQPDSSSRMVQMESPATIIFLFSPFEWLFVTKTQSNTAYVLWSGRFLRITIMLACLIVLSTRSRAWFTHVSLLCLCYVVSHTKQIPICIESLLLDS